MALEPLGNIMSVQAQPVQKVETAKPVANGTESLAQEVTRAVDPVTLPIKQVGSKEDGSEENGGKNEQNQPSMEQLKKAVDKMNKNLTNSSVQFGIHEATNRITIKVVDNDTKEVIRELPPEKTLDMIAKVWELAGILVDEKR